MYDTCSFKHYNATNLLKYHLIYNSPSCGVAKLFIMIQKLFCFSVMLLGFSCGPKDGSNQVAVNLKVNNCFNKFENKVKICLDSVFNDSRCPTGLVCVWEGDAIAAFSISRQDTIERFNLHSNKKFQNDTVIDGLTIKLLTIMPYPNKNSSIDPKSYNVEISVHRN